MSSAILCKLAFVALLVLIAPMTSSLVAWASSPVVLPSRDARLPLSATSPAFRPEPHPAVPSGRALTWDSASRHQSAFPTFGRNPRPAPAERPPDSVPSPA